VQEAALKQAPARLQALPPPAQAREQEQPAVQEPARVQAAALAQAQGAAPGQVLGMALV
jgi:hypothetical protein